MTTPGLKRPSDFDLQPHLNSGPVASTNGSGIVGDNNKRRCTSNFLDLHSQSSNNINSSSNIANSSPFKEPSKVLIKLNNVISMLIQDELQNTAIIGNTAATLCTNGINSNIKVDDNSPVLSIRQTHFICEKLVKEVDRKLREEYETKFTNTLAQTTTNIALNLQQQAAAAAAIQAQQHQPPHQQLQHHHPHHQQQHHHHLLHQQVHHHHQQLCSQSPLTNSAAASVAAAAAAASTMTSALNVASAFNMVHAGPVLLVSNLDEQLAIPESLFTLFGVFGDVIRVKILFNKKDNALIQMADANQAQVAQSYLDKQKIYGKIIRVTRSKHQFVQMPREGNQSDTGLTKDFTNSPLHRFKFPGSRNYLNIYAPSNTLHISNIPTTIDEDGILKVFKEACGFEAVSFKFFPKDKKMALMKFNSIEHAAIALIKMHNFQISDGNSLKVSFSKSVMV